MKIKVKSGEPIWALGLMSGTSMDGVDGAMVLTDGEQVFAFGQTGFAAYGDAEREVLSAGLGAWPEDASVPPIAKIIEESHAALTAQFSEVRLVGFHGQTLAHDPDGRQGARRTHQAGSGDELARKTGHSVIWDFRSADVGLGGQGAPLAAFFHFACAKYLKLGHPVAFLNLGGVGNLTYVDPRFARPDEEGAVLAFDTGPANAPINDVMLDRLGKRLDEGGALAARSTISQDILGRFLEHPYFLKIPPKSLDRDDFKRLLDDVRELETEDAVATLTACSAAAVLAGLEHLPEQPAEILVCGGGRHNKTMMGMIRRGTNAHLRDIDELGLDGDMLEAQAFAYLAVRVVRGLPTSCPSTTGVAASVGGGRISHPLP